MARTYPIFVGAGAFEPRRQSHQQSQQDEAIRRWTHFQLLKSQASNPWSDDKIE